MQEYLSDITEIINAAH